MTKQVKRVLVTGGAGFIGSHLCSWLLKKNCIVYCLDNFITGNKRTILPLRQNKNFILIEQDIIKPIKKTIKVDEVYNLACPASPGYYQLDPIHTIKTNVLGMLNVLNFAHASQAKVFQASTSEIYGDPLQHPQTESYWGNVNPLGIRSCYDEGKRCAETLCFIYHANHHVKIKIARIFNAYGPNMSSDDGRVISNFIVSALQNSPITVYGDGQQTRSFCFVSDIIDGILKLMNSKNTALTPINIGNPCELTIYDIAQKIIALTNSKSKIIFKPLPKDDPQRRKPDITKAKNLLKWSPKISLESGLMETIDYFKKNMRSK